MNKFVRNIKDRGDLLTSEDIDNLKQKFKVDDIRGDTLTVGDAFWPQFDFAHQAYNSVIIKNNAGESEPFNLYDYNSNGSGVYQDLGHQHVLIMTNGKFKLYEETQLPKMIWTVDGVQKAAELAADAHRVNENPVLRGIHRMICLFHNKIIDRGMGFEEARAQVVATMSVIALDSASKLTLIPASDIINEVVYEDMHRDVAGVAGTQAWGKPVGQGLYLERFKGAPDTALELVDFVYG